MHTPPCVSASAYHIALRWRIPAMDHRVFDRLTRRVSAAGTRRQAMRAVIGAALIGAATGDVVAKPKDKKVRTGRKDCRKEFCPSQVFKGKCCKDGSCSCGQERECCSGKCFWDNGTNPTKEFCCQGAKMVLCGNPEDKDAICCPRNGDEDSCSYEGGFWSCTAANPSGLPGSYRRP